MILKLNSLRFLKKVLVLYLWHDLLTSNAIVVYSRLPRGQICLQQIFLQLEAQINATGTAAHSGTTVQ